MICSFVPKRAALHGLFNLTGASIGSDVGGRWRQQRLDCYSGADCQQDEDELAHQGGAPGTTAESFGDGGAPGRSMPFMKQTEALNVSFKFLILKFTGSLLTAILINSVTTSTTKVLSHH